MKVVFLDWYGTLCSSRFYEHWSEVGHTRHGDFGRLQTWWSAPSSKPFMEAWLRGGKDAEAFVAEMSAYLAIPEPILWEELIASFQSWRLIDESCREQIAELRARGIRVILATDNVDACFRWGIQTLGLENTFGGVLSSHELGCCKGDGDDRGRSRFFAPFLNAEAIAPGESVLIDDSPGIAPVVERTGIGFLHAPFNTGPCAHLSEILNRL